MADMPSCTKFKLVSAVDLRAFVPRNLLRSVLSGSGSSRVHFRSPISISGLRSQPTVASGDGQATGAVILRRRSEDGYVYELCDCSSHLSDGGPN